LPRIRRASSPATRRPYKTILWSIAFCALAWACATNAYAVPTENRAVRDNVGIDQKLDTQVPGDIAFHDEAGQDVRLDHYFGKRPIVLALVYFRCETLCSLEINDLVRSMTVMPTSAGDDFDVIVVSFDPSDTPQTAAKRKQDVLDQYLKVESRPHAAQGIHFLTGSPGSIKRITEAVGFRYAQDSQYDVKNNQFTHASGIMILTPQGKISRYFYGIDYAAKDLRLALIDASGNKIGSLSNVLLFLCFHYDPNEGKYTVAVGWLLEMAAAATVLIMGSFIYLNLRREKRKAAAALQTTHV